MEEKTLECKVEKIDTIKVSPFTASFFEEVIVYDKSGSAYQAGPTDPVYVRR